MELNTFLEQLKSKVNIVDVASRYMTLTRKGNKYWGCCPFHHERTPSFAVDEIKQFYYCFGCHESGDVIKFVQNVESTDFIGAITMLSQIAGMEVPTFSGKNKDEISENKKKRERVYALLKEAAKYYNKEIYRPENKEKLQYLFNRGISQKTITRFGIGASTDWTSVIRHLKGLGFTDDEIIESGVAAKSDKGRIYDAYATRIIIPIIDSYGQVVAFGGRTLEKHAQAKYKNTGDTIAFNKRKVLYGLNLVKKQKLKEPVKSLILVEGYMDAISVYEQGFHNVVASMGTALTKEQAKLMHYVADDVYISYDGDAAGIKGAVLGQKILEDEGVNAKIVILRDNLDPDEIIRKYGKEEYRKALDNALTGTEFKFKILADKFDVSDLTGKKKYLENALRVISTLSTEAEKEEWLKKTSEYTSISTDSLRRDLAKVDKGEKVEINVESQAEKAADGMTKAIRFCLSLCIDGKKTVEEIAPLEEYITSDTHRKIYAYLKEKRGQKINGSMLFNVLDEDEYEELTKILEFSESEGVTEENEEEYFADCMRNVFLRSKEETLRRLKEMYRETDDLNEKKQITADILEVTKQLNNAKRGE